MIRSAALAVFGCLIASASLRADDLRPNGDPKQEPPKFLLDLETLQIANEEAMTPAYEKLLKAHGAAKTAAEREAADKVWAADFRNVWSPALKKALKIVEPHAADPASVNPLCWIVNKSEPESETAQAAFDLLVEYHLTNQRTLDWAFGNRRSQKKWIEPILRAQLAATDLPEDRRPKQMLALATCLQQSADMNPVGGEKLEVEAIELFTELGEKYPDKEIVAGLRTEAVAKAAVFAIKNLGVGKVAPEIEGEDLDGVTFKLSGYRGKVTMISFWGSWCGPCMELASHERALVERYNDRPLAIVGVNSDPDREKLKPVLAEHGITWRSFWSGEKGPSGAIPSTWNVGQWPTLYLLDGNGVIRAKNLFGTALEAKIEELVAGLESAAKPEALGAGRE